MALGFDHLGDEESVVDGCGGLKRDGVEKLEVGRRVGRAEGLAAEDDGAADVLAGTERGAKDRVASVAEVDDANVGGAVVDDFGRAFGENGGDERKRVGAGVIAECCEWLEGAAVVVEIDDAERGLDEALHLVERTGGDGGEIEYLGELLGELLDEVDFAVEVENFRA
jgi:hypothetical protein